MQYASTDMNEKIHNERPVLFKFPIPSEQTIFFVFFLHLLNKSPTMSILRVLKLKLFDLIFGLFEIDFADQ